MNKINKILTTIFKNNYIMLVFFLIISALLASIFMYEVISDFNNYHYYVAWAFLNNRTFVDLAIGLENSYHNPLIELPTYFISTKFNDYPIVLQLYHSVFWGILVFVFYKLSLLIFNVETIKGKIQIALSVIFTMTAFALMTQLGTSSNEIPAILCIMIGFYMVFKELFYNNKERKKIYFISALIMGMGLGLKFTVFTYCVAIGLTLMLFYKKFNNPIKIISLFALGGFIGFCITDGFWAYQLWKEFNNPLFPYLNNIFKSPYYPEKSLTYNTYFEKDFIDYLTFPFQASFQGEKKVTSEAEMLDIRLALGYTLLLFVFISLLFKNKLIEKIQKNTKEFFLIVFAFISYAIWLYMFSIIRYAIPIEMIICLLSVKFFTEITPKTKIGNILYLSFSIILIFMMFSGLPYKSWGTMKEADKIIKFEKVNLPENSLIIGISGNTGLAATQIINDNPSVKLANEVAEFIIENNKFQEKLEQYKKESSYIAYLTVLKTPLKEFDYYTPISQVKSFNTTNGKEDDFENLQFIIKDRLGKENFYCRSLNKSFYNVFLCIDKKDKETIFPEYKPQNSSQRFRQSIIKRKPIAIFPSSN